MYGKIRVLIVDDEERFRLTTQKVLNKKGFHVLLASGGREAIEKLEEHPDVVVLDVKMPEMDGLEALRELKKIKPGIEVIILTGHASVDAAIEGMKWGAFDFLIKPCDIEQLIDKIEEAYTRKKEREERIRKAERLKMRHQESP
ncbi:MAG: response regulator [Pseudomonadota bacterium]